MCTWQNIRWSNVTSERARELEDHAMFKFVKVSTIVEAWKREMRHINSPSARNVEILSRLQNLLDTMATV